MLKDKPTDDGLTPRPIGEHKNPSGDGLTPRPIAEHKPGNPATGATGQQPPAPQKSGKLALILICGVLVIVGIMTALWLERRAAAAKKAAASRATPPVAVIAGMVRNKDVPIYLDGLGTVQAFNTVTIHARVDGQLTKVAFTEGQDVHTGDLLFKIDPAPFQTQLEQNIAKKAQDAALLANARLDLNRETQLVAAKIDSQQVYDTQKALVDQYAATVNADQAAIDSAKVQLDYTTVNSPLDGRTGIRLVDQGNIVHATDTNGVVVITQLKPISVVFTLPEQTLEELHKNNALDNYKVLAVDRDNSAIPLDEGTLTVIDNQIDTTTGTLKLKATFPNNNLRLWPGQFVNARLLLTTRSNGVVVPAAVVQRGPQGDYAFVVETNGSPKAGRPQSADGKGAPKGDGKTMAKAGGKPGGGGTNDNSELATVRIQAVTDQIIGTDALIDSGLTPGQRVVVEGQYKLQDGSVVKVSMATKSTPKTNSLADSAP